MFHQHCYELCKLCTGRIRQEKIVKDLRLRPHLPILQSEDLGDRSLDSCYLARHWELKHRPDVVCNLDMADPTMPCLRIEVILLF